MNEPDDRIDFSALDPARDSTRWAHTVESVASRARQSRQRRHTVGRQMLAWAGPALAAAAAIALVSWIGAFTRHQPAASNPAASEPAYVLSTWAANNERPEPSEILSVLGEHHGAD